MYLPGCRMSNATVTISNGSINILGTITSLNQSGGFSIRLVTNNILKNGTIYTVAMKAKAEESSSCSIKDLLPYFSGTYERSYLDLANGVHIAKATNSSNAWFEIFLDSPNINDYINITFYDLAVYEGEFKNPPVTTSLDVKPSNQFLLTDYSNYNHFARGLKTTANTRYRLLNFGNVGNKCLYGEFILIKRYNETIPRGYKIQFCVGHFNDGVNYKGYIKINGFATSGTVSTTVNSVQLTHDDNNITYLCVTTGTADGGKTNQWDIYPILLVMPTGVGAPDIYKAYNEVCNQPIEISPDTDTVIATANTIDGF